MHNKHLIITSESHVNLTKVYVVVVVKEFTNVIIVIFSLRNGSLVRLVAQHFANIMARRLGPFHCSVCQIIAEQTGLVQCLLFAFQHFPDNIVGGASSE